MKVTFEREPRTGLVARDLEPGDVFSYQNGSEVYLRIENDATAQARAVNLKTNRIWITNGENQVYLLDHELVIKGHAPVVQR